jgi:hypothetical protein
MVWFFRNSVTFLLAPTDSRKTCTSKGGFFLGLDKVAIESDRVEGDQLNRTTSENWQRAVLCRIGTQPFIDNP